MGYAHRRRPTERSGGRRAARSERAVGADQKPNGENEMQVFVTGGSGFIGGHVVEQFVAQGHRVRAMARSERSARTVADFGAEPARCELGHVGVADLEGCEAVVHCAAFVEEWGTRDQFWNINVAGTTQLLAAAREAGVERFIFVGTEAALFDGRSLVDVDETEPYPPKQRFLYSETKAEAERRVLAADALGFTTLSIRPRFVWGPRDQSVLPAILEKVEAGNWAWIDHGRVRTSTTHVANLVAAIERALVSGRGGQAYFIADDEQTTLRSFLVRLAKTRGVTLPDRNVPRWLARATAAAVETVWRSLGIQKAPPVTRFAAAMLSSSITVCTEKAERELGYQPVIRVANGLAALAASDSGDASSRRRCQKNKIADGA